MFTDILVSLLASYKLTLSPKDFTRIKMDKDDEEEMQKYWQQYLTNEFQTSDFFVDTPEELMEKQRVFANPICLTCNMETYSLIKDEDNNILSKCPKCKHTYKTHI
jgi:hypothetical protein